MYYLIWNFCLLILSSSFRNENIKTPGFYTLQIIRVFSNFPRLKQLNKIKNTCEYFDLLDLLELEIRDSYKQPYCDCFFPFLTTMFSSTVVHIVQLFRN